ncbi:MAG TPA: hypothetical protein VFG79_01580, partial [Solirubrobacter sp.]|nr:hypothetical protein [Solirubrobacter sp.]
MHRRTLVLTTMALFGAGLAPAPASAHWSPRGCNTNGLDLTINKNKTVVRPGDTVVYGVAVRNDAGGSCDITDAGVTFALPGKDGRPSATAITLARGRTVPGGLGKTAIDNVPYVVDVNKGVASVTPLGRSFGVLHDSDIADGRADISKTLNTQITQPELDLTKVGSITAGQAPANVTYTYSVTNTSSTPVPMDHVTVSDNLCTDPTYSSGDNGDGVLSNGETWVFTCAMLHQAPGVYTNTASACAYSRVPGDTDRPVCTPPDTWTVTLTPPPAPPPRAGVLPASVTQAPCTLRTKRHLRVRARQLNTIRVRVRTDEPVAHKTVRLKLPGRKHTIKRKTNKKGVATFRVRPKRSGRARLTAGDCAKARISVKPARRVAARRVPRV